MGVPFKMNMYGYNLTQSTGVSMYSTFRNPHGLDKKILHITGPNFIEMLKQKWVGYQSQIVHVTR